MNLPVGTLKHMRGENSHKAGQEAEHDKASIDEVEEVGVLRAQVQRWEYGASRRNGSRIEAVHERDESDHAQNTNDLVYGRD